MRKIENAPIRFPLPKRDLRDFLEVPLRWRALVLVPTVCATVLGVAFSYHQPKLYRSSTLILVESPKIPAAVAPDGDTQNVGRRLQTLKQEILSRTRLEQIVKELDPYPEEMSRRSLPFIVERMREEILINVKGRDAFTIEYVSTSPTKAKEVTARLASLFIEETNQEGTRQAVAASDFMADQVEEAARALAAKEQALRVFKERHMGSLPDQLSTNLATLQRLQLQYQSVTESLRAANDRQVVIEKNLADQQRASGSAGTDPISELPRLQSELTTLRSKYRDEHPEVRALKARIDRLATALSSAEPAQQGSLGDPAVVAAQRQQEQVQIEIANLNAQRDDLVGQIAELQNRVDRVPANEAELQNLSREYSQLRANYDSLLQRRLAAGMAEKVEERWRGEHFRILDPAFVPDRPYYPNNLIFLLASLIGGLACGLGLAFGAEAHDHSIKSVGELTALGGYPVLASVPHFDALPDEGGGHGLFGRG